MAAASSSDSTTRVWELMKKIGICMLATVEGGVMRCRPMGAFAKQDENTIYFLTDANRHKVDEIAANPQVCLAFADTGGQKYVSVSGRASVSNDRAKIKELWSTPAKAWWDSPDDPDIRVLKVAPEDAEYWDNPGSIVSYVKMVAASMTGERPDIGENRKVAL